MICASLYYHEDVLWRFKIEGHAGYAEHGSDIVCAAVSILTFNTVNAIEEFTDEEVCIKEMNDSQGLLDCEFPKRKLGQPSLEAELLLNTMLLGIKSIKETYGENHIKVKTIRR